MRATGSIVALSHSSSFSGRFSSAVPAGFSFAGSGFFRCAIAYGLRLFDLICSALSVDVARIDIEDDFRVINRLVELNDSGQLLVRIEPGLDHGLVPRLASR